MNDIVRRSNILTKKRRRKINLDNLISDIDNIRFVVLYQKHINTFGINSVKVPVVTKLINSYNNKIDIEKTKIIVDGSPPPSVNEDIHFVLSKTYGKNLSRSQIQFIDEADKYYNIVNVADSIAYQLNKAYSDVIEGKGGPFEEKRVNFDLVCDSKPSRKQKYLRKIL